MSLGAGGGGAAVEMEADLVRAMLPTRGATPKRYTPQHPDTDATQTSVSEYLVIWHVFLKHETYVVSYDMSSAFPAKVIRKRGR